MKVYTVRDVSKLLELSPGQVRSYARAGLLQPDRGSRGEYRFSFQDLVLLRTARGLMRERIPPRKIRRALRKLKQQLPTDQSLTGVQIHADGENLIVQDGESIWNPDSGQSHLNFDTSGPATTVAPHCRPVPEDESESEEDFDADDWYGLGTELESGAPDHARDAYRRALELNPHHSDSRVNLGRLLHEQRRFEAAEAHYRLALEVRPQDATAWFNLGVCLDDLGRAREAIEAYLRAIESDPECADAHYNVARLYERLKQQADAVSHLKTYRRLTQGR